MSQLALKNKPINDLVNEEKDTKTRAESATQTKLNQTKKGVV